MTVGGRETKFWQEARADFVAVEMIDDGTLKLEHLADQAGDRCLSSSGQPCEPNNGPGWGVIDRNIRRGYLLTHLVGSLSTRDLSLLMLVSKSREQVEQMVSWGGESGRTWDRTRDLSRVKRALSR
jgi:hypothetical protein